jgi:ABC-type nitrate/sulfonate/bicarbonate transport system permease component
MRKVAVALWLPAVLICGWWILSADSTSVYFPPLSDILRRLQEQWFFAEFGSDLLPSLRTMLLGFLIAVVVGILAGTLFGLVPILNQTFLPLASFLRSIPPVMLLPPAVILFGFGDGMRIGVVAFGAVWPTLLNTIDGVRSFDQGFRDVLQSYRIPRFRQILFVVLPNAMPQILSGVGTSLQFSLIMLVVSESVAATHGIGFKVMQAQRSFDSLGTWAGTLLLGIVGILLGLAFELFRHRAIRWFFLREKQG